MVQECGCGVAWNGRLAGFGVKARIAQPGHQPQAVAEQVVRDMTVDGVVQPERHSCVPAVQGQIEHPHTQQVASSPVPGPVVNHPIHDVRLPEGAREGLLPIAERRRRVWAHMVAGPSGGNLLRWRAFKQQRVAVPAAVHMVDQVEYRPARAAAALPEMCWLDQGQPTLELAFSYHEGAKIVHEQDGKPITGGPKSR